MLFSPFIMVLITHQLEFSVRLHSNVFFFVSHVTAVVVSTEPTETRPKFRKVTWLLPVNILVLFYYYQRKELTFFVHSISCSKWEVSISTRNYKLNLEPHPKLNIPDQHAGSKSKFAVISLSFERKFSPVAPTFQLVLMLG